MKEYNILVFKWQEILMNVNFVAKTKKEAQYYEYGIWEAARKLSGATGTKLTRVL